MTITKMVPSNTYLYLIADLGTALGLAGSLVGRQALSYKPRLQAAPPSYSIMHEPKK